jgi:CheY-like chemotaxis protein
MLEQSGFKTLQAEDGLEGLRLLQDHKPDVVTCDISMPLMDGYQFLVKAKKDPATCHIPIIVVTAIGQEDDVAKANAMGADAYLTKPFSSSNLIETIQTQLKSKSSVQVE